MTLLFRRQKSKAILLVSVVFTILVVYTVLQNLYQLKNALSYATRPIWDKKDGPTEIIPHFYGEGMKMDGETCKLHGWTERKEKENLKVLDAVLMSNELDLMEIRMNELDSIVDYFLIIESNATFTGLPKDTFFLNNRGRFIKFDKKIVYYLLPGFPLRPGQSPWDVERDTRIAMSRLIQSQISTFPTTTQSLILMSDLDEIPARHTVDLLKTCDFGPTLHLQLREYLYSFEWYLGPQSWRASAHMWGPQSSYRHSKTSEYALADAGWHCSYCFRTISEYALKMKGFSHADRIAGRLNLLEPKRIQDVICTGKDIFGMLPEAYSYRDLLSQMSLQPLKTAVGLPRYLIENGAEFRFLLPGGCIREQ